MNKKLLNPKFNFDPMNGSIRDLDGIENGSTCAFSPQGAYFALGHTDGCISIWSYSTMIVMVKSIEPEDMDKMDSIVIGEKKKKGKLEKQITQLRWTHDGKYILSGTENGVIRVWNVKEGTLFQSIRFNPSLTSNGIASIHLHPHIKGLGIVCTKKSGAWNVNYLNGSFTPLIILDNEKDNIETLNADGSIKYVAATYSIDGKYVISCDSKGCIRLRSQQDNTLITHLQLVRDTISKSGVRPLEVTPDGNNLIIASGGGLRTISLNPLFQVAEYMDKVNTCSFEFISIEPNGKRILAVPDRWSLNSTGSMYVFTQDQSEEVVTKMIDDLGFACWCSTAPWVLLITKKGAVHILERQYESKWAGPMFPVGFELLTDNDYYKEKEDEFDVKEEAADGEFNVNTQTKKEMEESEYIDIITLEDNTDGFLGINRDGDLFLPVVPLPDKEEHIENNKPQLKVIKPLSVRNENINSDETVIKVSREREISNEDDERVIKRPRLEE